MEIILKENIELKEKLAAQMSNVLKMDSPPTEFGMLNLLLECAKSNAGKKPGGWRFHEVVKELAFLIYSLGGLALYEVLCYKQNFPFPSITTIRRKIYCNDKFVEGVFRIKQLKQFLILHECPLTVHLCEDATVVTGRIQYDSASNQIVGPTLPLDSNGLPIIGSFPATSASKIAEYFEKYDTSRYAYCIMAVPLKQGAPSFCLSLYGTNNKFKASDVKSRLAWTQEALHKEGIQVISFASDGDTRLLSTMYQNHLVFLIGLGSVPRRK
ncbi:uncharacterized protein LOC117642048 [Thrips palmi]|uniref:Uncharacterized protein LOC117642048 n=1 Tax=Thrips palmi TaxID=161013 RepID=A0A6P8ZJQ2_THRPL|nr:uncharacterized protein LOC117642048 [Thrips palmi]